MADDEDEKPPHWDHYHRAFSNGGLIPEPVLGIGKFSGKTYVFGENGPERVIPATE